MGKEIRLLSKKIGDEYPPFIIAEMSGNHNQSLDRALLLVDAAASAGAHALKLQTYTADTLTIDCDLPDFLISNSKSLWKGKTLYDLYKEAYTPWEWHLPIFERARKHGMIPFSTPFDDSAVDFLEELEVPFYKIASFENNHFPLLRKVARTGKPVIMSTGLATLADLEAAVSTLRENGCDQIILLKCTSSYPSSPVDSNIRTIPDMAARFDCHVGLSDHTLGVGVALAAISLGARVIEKHFTLSRTEGGVDSAFSLEPAELKLLVEESERAFLALGKINYEILPAEVQNISFKRSIYIVQDVKRGEVLSEKNIAVIRPGHGASPKFFEKFLGKKAKRDIARGTPLSDALTENL